MHNFLSLEQFGGVLMTSVNSVWTFIGDCWFSTPYVYYIRHIVSFLLNASFTLHSAGRLNQRDTDRSRYFAITEFNNCFIIRRSLSLFFTIILGKREAALPKCWSNRRIRYSFSVQLFILSTVLYIKKV